MQRKGPQRNLEKQRFWQRAVAQWRRSGQSVREFCRNNSLNEPSFYAWRRELTQRGRSSRAAAKTPRPPASFLPVEVVGTESPFAATGGPPAGGVEILLAHRRAVRVPPGFDRQTLSDVLAVLEARTC